MRIIQYYNIVCCSMKRIRSDIFWEGLPSSCGDASLVGEVEVGLGCGVVVD